MPTDTIFPLNGDTYTDNNKLSCMKMIYYRWSNICLFMYIHTERQSSLKIWFHDSLFLISKTELFFSLLFLFKSHRCLKFQRWDRKLRNQRRKINYSSYSALQHTTTTTKKLEMVYKTAACGHVEPFRRNHNTVSCYKLTCLAVKGVIGAFHNFASLLNFNHVETGANSQIFF